MLNFKDLSQMKNFIKAMNEQKSGKDHAKILQTYFGYSKEEAEQIAEKIKVIKENIAEKAMSGDIKDPSDLINLLKESDIFEGKNVEEMFSKIENLIKEKEKGESNE